LKDYIKMADIKTEEFLSVMESLKDTFLG